MNLFHACAITYKHTCLFWQSLFEIAVKTPLIRGRSFQILVGQWLHVRSYIEMYISADESAATSKNGYTSTCGRDKAKSKVRHVFDGSSDAGCMSPRERTSIARGFECRSMRQCKFLDKACRNLQRGGAVQSHSSVLPGGGQ